MNTPDPCQAVREALIRRADLSEAARAHLARCPACEALADDEGRLARALAGSEPPEATDDLLAALGPMLQAEDRSAVGRLRAWPTWARIAAVFAAAALTVLVIVLVKPRPDLPTYPGGRTLWVLGSLGVAALLLSILALRPLHRALASRGQVALTSLAATGWVALVCLTGLPTDYDPSASVFVQQALHCLAFGALFSAPALVLAIKLDRSPSPRFWAAALVGGLAANATLHIFCPIEHAGHQIAGHWAVMALLLLAGLAWRASTTRR